jgi:hypothetical protein
MLLNMSRCNRTPPTMVLWFSGIRKKLTWEGCARSSRSWSRWRLRPSRTRSWCVHWALVGRNWLSLVGHDGGVEWDTAGEVTSTATLDWLTNEKVVYCLLASAPARGTCRSLPPVLSLWNMLRAQVTARPTQHYPAPFPLFQFFTAHLKIPGFNLKSFKRILCKCKN